MTTALSASPHIAALLLQVVDRLEAEYPTLPPGTVVRCVEVARVSARTSTSEAAGYVDVIEGLARTDLVTLRLLNQLDGHQG